MKFFKSPPHADLSRPVRRLASIIGSQDAALAVCMRAWSHAFTEGALIDGPHPDRELASIVRWRSRKATAADALVAAGVVQRAADMLRIVPWEDIATVDWIDTPDPDAIERLAARRKKDADRKRTRRGQRADNARTTRGKDADTKRTEDEKEPQVPEITGNVLARVHETQTADGDADGDSQHLFAVADAPAKGSDPADAPRHADQRNMPESLGNEAAKPILPIDPRQPSLPLTVPEKQSFQGVTPDVPAKPPQTPNAAPESPDASEGGRGGDRAASGQHGDPEADAYMAEYRRLYPAAGVKKWGKAWHAWRQARKSRSADDLMRALRANAASGKRDAATLSLGASLSEGWVQRGLLDAAAPAPPGKVDVARQTVPLAKSAAPPLAVVRTEMTDEEKAKVREQFEATRKAVSFA